jgi:hypothetical protein
MKKTLLAGAILMTLALSGTASALNTNVIRQIRSSNLPLQNSLGTVSFTALGIEDQHCMYLMDWQNPFNPNAAQLCVLAERRTPVYNSCILNAFRDITTYVSSGPGAECSTYCNGYDTLGIAYENVTLLTGEYKTAPVLQGVAIFPTAIPLIHAIEVA